MIPGLPRRSKNTGLQGIELIEVNVLLYCSGTCKNTSDRFSNQFILLVGNALS